MNNSIKSHHPVLVGSIFVFIGAIGFSSKAVLVKLAYQYGVDVETLFALRMLFSAPFFICLTLWINRENGTQAATLTLKDWFSLVMLGFCGVYLAGWLDFAGLTYVSAGLERTVLFLYPTMVILISAVLFKQGITKRELFALLASYVGIGLAVGHDIRISPLGVHATLIGATFVFLSALVYAIYLVFNGRIIQRIGTARFTAYTMLAGCSFSMLHFVLTHPFMSLQQPVEVYGLSFLMAVIATVLPALLLNSGIRRLGSSKASLVSSVGPVSTILLAYLFLDETMSELQILGTILVMIGVLAISLQGFKWRRSISGEG
ncbi:multidrug DMT transporter permease [Methylovorus sp. MM2]|uniref:DMT family transporter n=1 Tax=Methylovorus sp. MM2 TaxID=1848038 RepID=UPI0007E0BA0E|nr:DMT family transporter [Methylovorus sp. MM2]OAM51766.1 multidrug DMT transporter permease [Methylovorus sp. MM2]